MKNSVLSHPWTSVRNLLVMRLDNIGDVIMTSPALRSIKANLPDAKLTLMASPGGSIAAPLLPWVDEILTWRVLWQDLGRLTFDPTREWELVEKLRGFDAVIIFTSFSQSPHPAAFLACLAGIPLRLGESKEKGGMMLTHEVSSAPDELHQVERNLRLIESVGFEVRDRSLAIQYPKTHLIDQPYIVLNPWTSCQSRNYDAKRFAIAAQQLATITGWKVVVTGVEKDRDRAEIVLDILDTDAIDFIGKTSLPELAALIANAKLMLSNNTSTMHIADATRTPSVIMFAGTELECQWQPRNCSVRLLRQPTSCHPCYAFQCLYDLECLDIEPEEIVRSSLELLEESCLKLR